MTQSALETLIQSKVRKPRTSRPNVTIELDDLLLIDEICKAFDKSRNSIMQKMMSIAIQAEYDFLLNNHSLLLDEMIANVEDEYCKECGLKPDNGPHSEWAKWHSFGRFNSDQSIIEED